MSAGLPGGKCPRCRGDIKTERRGKQNCPHCFKRLDIEIKDVPVNREAFGKDTDMRTWIREA
jgi:predicted amidophosphoribosyltransferase